MARELHQYRFFCRRSTIIWAALHIIYTTVFQVNCPPLKQVSTIYFCSKKVQVLRFSKFYDSQNECWICSTIHGFLRFSKLSNWKVLRCQNGCLKVLQFSKCSCKFQKISRLRRSKIDVNPLYRRCKFPKFSRRRRKHLIVYLCCRWEKYIFYCCYSAAGEKIFMIYLLYTAPEGDFLGIWTTFPVKILLTQNPWVITPPYLVSQMTPQGGGNNSRNSSDN